MNNRLRELKKAIRAFFRITQQRGWLLTWRMLKAAKSLPGADRAETAFFELGRAQYKHPIAIDSMKGEAQRRRVLIPMIKAELWLRGKQADRIENNCEYALIRKAPLLPRP